jgi:hypothetical protein
MSTHVITSAVVCRLVDEAELPAWGCFVVRHPHASVYHLLVWRRIVAEACGKAWYLVAAFHEGEICTRVPLVSIHVACLVIAWSPCRMSTIAIS